MPSDNLDSTSPIDQSGIPTLGELVDAVRPHVEHIEDGFKAIRVTLDALSEHLGASPSRSAPPAVDVADPVQQSLDVPVAVATAAPPREPSPPVAAPAAVPVELPPRADLPPTAAPPVAATPIQAAGDGGNWSHVVFGDLLSVDPSISSLSGVLLNDVYSGDNDAIGMMGHLLMIRTATAERMARSLKDVGEAFYCWKPSGDATLRDALIRWVHALLDEAGLGNRIAIVQPGDRYDMQSHNAKERGAEVADVHGWVVLRDNGKVYSKANVAVR